MRSFRRRFSSRTSVVIAAALAAGLIGRAEQAFPPGPRYTISGRVIDPLRLQPEDALLTLGRVNDDDGAFGSAPVQMGADGGFVARDLAPGTYIFEVVRTPHSATKSAVPVAFHVVRVINADVTDVTVLIRRDTAVTGRFRMESEDPAAAWPPHIHVNAQLALDGLGFAGSKGADGAPAGTFILRNAFGPRVLRCGYQLAPNSWWWPSRVLLDGVDITNVPTDFSEHESGRLEVVFTQRPPRLRGTVTDADGTPVRAPWIVVASANKSLWQFWSTTSDVAQGDMTGSFSLPLLPGDYLVRALPQSTFDSWPAARLHIEKYAADGLPVTVAESGATTVALKVQAAAVAVGVYRTSSRGGSRHSFDAAEESEVQIVRQGEQVPGNTATSARSRRQPVGVSNNSMPPLPPATAPHGELPLRVSGKIAAPRKIVDVTGVTPSRARRAGISGVVILEITVGVDGSVTATKVLHSVPLLDQAAIDTVRQWRYEPTLLNGSPVPIIMTVAVSFR
jgi:TonB family protein